MSERIQIEPISGFPDWLPNVRLQEERFLATIRQQYQLYGFTPIETPAVERMEVLTRQGGHAAADLHDRRAEEGDADAALGLHFDLTVPLARVRRPVCGQAGLSLPPLSDPEGLAGRAGPARPVPGVLPVRRRYHWPQLARPDPRRRDPLRHQRDVRGHAPAGVPGPDLQPQGAWRPVKSGRWGPSRLVPVLRAIDKTHRAGIEADAGSAQRSEQARRPGSSRPSSTWSSARGAEDARRVLQPAGAATDGLGRAASRHRQHHRAGHAGTPHPAELRHRPRPGLLHRHDLRDLRHRQGGLGQHLLGRPLRRPGHVLHAQKFPAWASRWG